MPIKKFLTQRAVDVAVNGTYTIPNWYDPQGRPRTFACRTKRVSPFRMMVDVPVLSSLGTRITSYFPDFGKLEGVIDDSIGNGFLLELEMDQSARRKMADKLTWLEKKKSTPDVEDLRENARIIPVSPHSVLTLADGTTHTCFVIDMSVDGVAVSSEVQPEIGTPLAIGVCVGRVIRHFPEGFAIRFVERQNRNHLNQLVTRPRMLRGKAEELNNALVDLTFEQSDYEFS